MSLRSLLVGCVLVLAGWVPQAWAEPYRVETVGIKQRARAESAQSLAAVEGLDVQLVRNFERGWGWVWVLRLEKVDGREAASAEAKRLATATGQTVQVFLVAGRDVLPVDELTVTPSPELVGTEDSGTPSGVGPARSPSDGADLLAAVVLAHRGTASGQALADRGTASAGAPVHFRFEREVDIGHGALRVWHDYWSAGDDLRLEVRVLEGEGRDSLTIVRGHEAAWLRVDGQTHAVEPGPTREALAVFDPAIVLERGLALADLPVGTRARVVSHRGGAPELTWLDVDGGTPEARILLGIDPADHRVRELVMVGVADALRWSFGDYREDEGGIVVPLRLEAWYGEQLRERVVVRVLERPSAVTGELFDPDGTKNP